MPARSATIAPRATSSRGVVKTRVSISRRAVPIVESMVIRTARTGSPPVMVISSRPISALTAKAASSVAQWLSNSRWMARATLTPVGASWFSVSSGGACGELHGDSPSAAPVIRPAIRARSAAGSSAMPETAPRYMTATRSDTSITSSRSLLMNRTAVPPAAALRIRSRTALVAPGSRPRVGWLTTSTAGAPASARARTTFCWFPPDIFLDRRVRRRRHDAVGLDRLRGDGSHAGASQQSGRCEGPRAGGGRGSRSSTGPARDLPCAGPRVRRRSRLVAPSRRAACRRR